MQDSNLQSILNKQRSDKFRLILTIPKALRGLDTKDFSITQKNLINSDSLQFSLFSASIPKVSVPKKDIGYDGQSFGVTSQSRPSYEPVNCKFVVDNRFKNYWMLWKWLSILNGIRTSGMAPSLSENVGVPQVGIIAKQTNFWDYQTNISLIPLDEYNESMCEFIFYNAFITDLSRLEFNYQTADELPADFTFSFGQMDILIKD